MRQERKGGTSTTDQVSTEQPCLTVSLHKMRDVCTHRYLDLGSSLFCLT